MLLLPLLLIPITFVVAVLASSGGNSKNNPSSTSQRQRLSSSSSSSLLSSPPPPLSPIGLVNLGNTCYLNSQLQCAFSIPRVRDLLLLVTDNDDGDDVPQQQQQHPRTILGQLFADMKSSQEETRSLGSSSSRRRRGSSSTGGVAVETTLRSFCRALGIPVYEQQDSQEFWKLLLPTLQCPALLDLYKGELETYIKAYDGRERRRRETYLDLSLDIGGGGGTTTACAAKNVKEAIVRSYLTPEPLLVVEGNGWRPGKGEEPVDAEKGAVLLLQCLPSVLQLHLKRFEYDWQSGMMNKINTRLPFPLQLKLPVAVAAANGHDDAVDNITAGCDYVLQAVVVHAGEYGSGHYYAYVRPNPLSEQWFRCNDELIDAVTWEEVALDAFGGRYEPSVESQEVEEQQEPPIMKIVGGQPLFASVEKQANPLVRFLCCLRRRLRLRKGRSSPFADPYGFGGRTSSAYVLQYVRRCQIDVLFGT
jgi:ubiquitin C-terminal hydrolase